ncbi:putative Mn2+ efflux pump MntP [Bacilli bacterium PM5-3]|nr:putative Mn2+ efflux pump MntP [Bacilli bacterium PM5-3]MDH6603586.1 putative Mn2+ efflux pump MntP [Bacilli bacterium PM5-9]
MSVIGLIILSIGLAMDAFAVSITQGIHLKNNFMKRALIISGIFGIFQALMPLLGYLFGIQFKNIINDYDHWVAFTLLAIIGLKMIYESFKSDEDIEIIDITRLLILGLATSIDALAIGVSFAFLNVNIISACIYIGVITFILSIIGIKIGASVGDKYKNKSELLGGIILIFIGIKILVEHLNLLG